MTKELNLHDLIDRFFGVIVQEKRGTGKMRISAVFGQDT